MARPVPGLARGFGAAAGSRPEALTRARCPWRGRYSLDLGRAVTVGTADSDSASRASPVAGRRRRLARQQAKTRETSSPRQGRQVFAHKNARRVPRGHALNSAGDT